MLAGGAAKGAYESGVMDFLAQQHITVDAIAGTSIGALNGALMASSATVADGAEAVRRVWDMIGARFGDLPDADADTSTWWEPAADVRRRLMSRFATAMRERGFLEEIAQQIDPARIRAGRPFWIAAYPMLPKYVINPFLRHYFELVRAVVRSRSELIRLNDLGDDDIRNAVLGSAALPYILPSRTVAGQRYRDGWIGGENIPVGALVQEERCEAVIVVHLDRVVSQRWDKFPTLRRVDIVPSEPLSPPGPLGMVTGLFDFSPKRSAHLRDLGHRDATTAFHTTITPVVGIDQLRSSESMMLDALSRARSSDAT